MQEWREDRQCLGCRASEGEGGGRALQLIVWAFTSLGEVGSCWWALERGRCVLTHAVGGSWLLHWEETEA